MKQEEQSLQISVCKFLGYAFPDLLFCHVPNGGKRSKAQGGIFKAMGVKAGMPDLLFWWISTEGSKSAAIELKSSTGRLNPNQKAMHAHLEANGVPVAICKSLEEVRSALQSWGLKSRVKLVGW